MKKELVMRTSFLALIILVFALYAIPAYAAPQRNDNQPDNHHHHRVKANQTNGNHSGGHPSHPSSSPSSNGGNNHPHNNNGGSGQGNHPNNGGGSNHPNNGGHQNNGGEHQYNGGGAHQDHYNGGNERRIYHPRPEVGGYGLIPFIVDRLLDNNGRNWATFDGNWSIWDQNWNGWDDSWDNDWAYREGEIHADRDYIERTLRGLVDSAHDNGYTPVARFIWHVRDTRTWEFTVPPGHYTLFAAGGLNIDDLAIRLTDREGNQIAEDDENNSTPSIWFDPSDPLTVQIEADVNAYNDDATNDYVCALLVQR